MSAWTEQWAAGMGRKDMEDLLEKKSQQSINAKKLADDLMNEYVEMVEAAAASGYHPKSELRLGIMEAPFNALGKQTADFIKRFSG